MWWRPPEPAVGRWALRAGGDPMVGGVFFYDLQVSCGLISSTFWKLASAAKEGSLGFQSNTDQQETR